MHGNSKSIGNRDSFSKSLVFKYPFLFPFAPPPPLSLSLDQEREGKGGGRGLHCAYISSLSLATSLGSQHHRTCPPSNTHTHLDRGSCSGKSSLANHLCEKFPHAITIHQDDFYKVSIALLGAISCLICIWSYSHILNIKLPLEYRSGDIINIKGWPQLYFLERGSVWMSFPSYDNILLSKLPNFYCLSVDIFCP